MVIAHHIILTAYGFWLPNDPRGSWSTEVWATHLQPFGPATRVDTHRSVAGVAHDRASRLAAKRALKYPAVLFDDQQINAIASGFESIIHTTDFHTHACAIMPDHVHLVMARHALKAEEIAGYMKRAATRSLNAAGIHPLRGHVDSRGRTPTPWAEHGWWVFLDTPDDVLSRVHYVEMNPIKAGRPAQRWPFVAPFPV